MLIGCKYQLFGTNLAKCKIGSRLQQYYYS